jgi:hypothetical protein
MKPASTDLAATRDLFLRLTSQHGKQKRSLELLKSPEAPPPADWHFHMPAFFHNALDLKLSDRKKGGRSYQAWTQGADFSFSIGDTLYDTPAAYEPWETAIKKIRLCAQVVEAVPSSGTETGTRFEGRVKVDLLVPDAHRARLVKKATADLTQDEFVSLLIFGPSESLRTELEG